MAAENSQDLKLVERFQHGEIDAFDELVSRYESRIYTMGRRMCQDDEDAKDMLQETFTAAFRGLTQFRGDSKVSVWLYQIAKHACLKMRRKSKFAPSHLLSIEPLLPDEAEKSTLELADWRRTPVEELLNAELGEKLEETLQQMPPDYRIVFLLRDVEGFSIAETAKILERSVPLVKTRLHRARLFVRKQLHGYYTDGRLTHD